MSITAEELAAEVRRLRDALELIAATKPTKEGGWEETGPNLVAFASKVIEGENVAQQER